MITWFNHVDNDTIRNIPIVPLSLCNTKAMLTCCGVASVSVRLSLSS